MELLRRKKLTMNKNLIFSNKLKTFKLVSLRKKIRGLNLLKLHNDYLKIFRQNKEVKQKTVLPKEQKLKIREATLKKQKKHNKNLSYKKKIKYNKKKSNFDEIYKNEKLFIETCSFLKNDNVPVKEKITKLEDLIFSLYKSFKYENNMYLTDKSFNSVTNLYHLYFIYKSQNFKMHLAEYFKNISLGLNFDNNMKVVKGLLYHKIFFFFEVVRTFFVLQKINFMYTKQYILTLPKEVIRSDPVLSCLAKEELDFSENLDIVNYFYALKIVKEINYKAQNNVKGVIDANSDAVLNIFKMLLQTCENESNVSRLCSEYFDFLFNIDKKNQEFYIMTSKFSYKDLFSTEKLFHHNYSRRFYNFKIDEKFCDKNLTRKEALLNFLNMPKGFRFKYLMYQLNTKKNVVWLDKIFCNSNNNLLDFIEKGRYEIT